MWKSVVFVNVIWKILPIFSQSFFFMWRLCVFFVVLFRKFVVILFPLCFINKFIRSQSTSFSPVFPQVFPQLAINCLFYLFHLVSQSCIVFLVGLNLADSVHHCRVVLHPYFRCDFRRTHS